MRIDEQSLGHAPRAHSSASHSTSTKAIHPSLSRILHPRGSQRKPRRPPPRPRRRSARVGATTGCGQARVGATTGVAMGAATALELGALNEVGEAEVGVAGEVLPLPLVRGGERQHLQGGCHSHATPTRTLLDRHASQVVSVAWLGDSVG